MIGFSAHVADPHLVKDVRVLEGQIGDYQVGVQKVIYHLRIDHPGLGDLVRSNYFKILEMLFEHRRDDLIKQPISMPARRRARITDRANDEAFLCGVTHR